MRLWFTSDTHFCHENVIGYCKRPFTDVEEMDSEMVRRWNERVAPDDTVFHLGDFSFGSVAEVEHFHSQLEGEIYLIRGNHDKSVARLEKIFGIGRVHNEKVIHVDDRYIFLTHKPRATWDPEIAYHFHGHVHNGYARRGNAINVGVDVRGFAPASFEELLATPEEGESDGT